MSEAPADPRPDDWATDYDLFDDRFLGEKSSAPTLDNDGNALAERLEKNGFNIRGQEPPSGWQ